MTLEEGRHGILKQQQFLQQSSQTVALLISLFSYTTASLSKLLLKSHYAGETDLVENWLPHPCLLLDNQLQPSRPTPTHTAPTKRGVNRALFNITHRHFPLLFVRSSSYARVAYWVHVKYWKTESVGESREDLHEIKGLWWSLQTGRKMRVVQKSQ